MSLWLIGFTNKVTYYNTYNHLAWKPNNAKASIRRETKTHLYRTIWEFFIDFNKIHTIRRGLLKRNLLKQVWHKSQQTINMLYIFLSLIIIQNENMHRRKEAIHWPKNLRKGSERRYTKKTDMCCSTFEKLDRLDLICSWQLLLLRASWEHRLSIYHVENILSNNRNLTVVNLSVFLEHQ